MKRMIMCSLLFISALVRSEQPSVEIKSSETSIENQGSKYKDWLRFLELNKANQENQEISEAKNCINIASHSLVKEHIRCEGAGDCEESAEFSRLFDELADATSKLHILLQREDVLLRNTQISDILLKNRK